MNGKRQWRLSFWPVLAFACVLPILVALGIWQVQRGMEKQATYDEFASAVSRDARDMAELSLAEVNSMPRYEHVMLRGRYLAGRQFLLDNMSRNGRPGHHVLTPLVPDGANYAVIVDRGWRPGRAVEMRSDVPVDEGPVTVRGMLAPFTQPALDLGSGQQADGDWPRVVQFPDAGELALMLNRDVAASRLLLDAGAAGGFEREWTPPGIPPARHYAYAFQWFALAAALIAIFIFLARPRRAEGAVR